MLATLVLSCPATSTSKPSWLVPNQHLQQSRMSSLGFTRVVVAFPRRSACMSVPVRRNTAFFPCRILLIMVWLVIVRALRLIPQNDIF